MNDTCLFCYGHGKTWRILPKPEGWQRCSRCRGTGKMPAWVITLGERSAYPTLWPIFVKEYRAIYGSRPTRRAPAHRYAFALWMSGRVTGICHASKKPFAPTPACARENGEPARARKCAPFSSVRSRPAAAGHREPRAPSKPQGASRGAAVASPTAK